MLGSSFARSRSHEQNINQESHLFSGPEKCPEPKIERIIVESMDQYQINQKMILKDQPFSYEDVDSEVNVTQNQQRNITFKEMQLQVVDRQPIEEEDAGSSSKVANR